MSHPETDTNVSSLLMQAARSAAIEDGVAVPDAVSLPPPTGTTIRDSMATGGHGTSSGCGGGNGGALEKSSGAVVGEMKGGVGNQVGGANANANATTNTAAAILNMANEGTSELSLIKNAGGKQTNDMMSSVATAAVAANGIASAIAIPPSVSSITTGSVNPNNNGHSSSIIMNNNNNNNSNNKHHSTSAGTAAHLASSLKAAESRPILSSNNNNNNNNNNNRSDGSTSNDTAISVPGPSRSLAASSPPSLVPPAAAATVSSSSSSSNRTGNADVANANGSTTSGGGKKKGPPLRRGKWSAEEEAYANRLIMEFKAGLLPLTDGTTLRTFLSKLLNCDPMRISKKFVGNNCIGKQVFRRRTADINRLTPEQIQQNRAELSELERRFLDKVAQTNRMKTSGVNNTSNNTETTSEAPPEITSKVKEDGMSSAHGLTPPWLRPPNGFKHGTGAATAAAHLSSGSNRAAMAGRALLQGYSNNAYSNNHVKQQQPLNSNLNKTASAGLLALMELQQRQGGGSNLLSSGSNYSASNFLAAAVAEREKNNNGGNSMLDLMLKSGLSRDQLNQLVNEHRDTSNSLSDMLKRQSSLDALMSLDFQSLQSIDNLANLIQNGRSNQNSNIMGTKNWQPDSNSSANHLAPGAASIGSNSNLSNLANARRLQSEGRMESLIRSLSNNNFSRGPGNLGSNANFNTLLQNMQNNLGGSTNNMLNSASAFDLANMLRADSSTGLTALRMQEGLTQRNSSVDDFLSLVASGDIPHEDPHLLNIPLQSLLQQHQQNNNNSAAAQLLAQQQILAQAANGSGNSLNRFAQFNNNFSHNNLQSSNPSNNNGRNSGITNSNSINAFGDHFSSLGNLANSNSAASLLSHYASQNGSSLGNFSQYQQHNQHPTQPQTAAVPQDNNLKRKYPSNQNTNNQGPSKR